MGGGGGLFSGKKRGQRLFPRKKGGAVFFSEKKGAPSFLQRKKGGEDFFQDKKGARIFFDIPKEGGQHFFSRESRGAKTFPIISPNRQLNVFLEKDRNKWVFAVSMILGKKTLFLATFLLSSV